MSDDAGFFPPQGAGDMPEEGARPDLAALDETAKADPALFERQSEEDVFARRVLTTALHLEVAEASRTNLWTEWNGYTTADVLTNIEDEYAALRHAAALSDISPLVKYRISGPDALRYLIRLVAGHARDLAIDHAAHVVFCEDRGFVVGDGLLFRLGESEYRLVTEEHNLDWLLESARGFSVSVEDVSPTLAALSLQGPLSARILRDAGFAGIESLAPNTACWFDVDGMPVYVSRTGVSGDLGYEFWIDPDDAPALWIKLLARGAGTGLGIGGFALRELARTEAGIARAGRDYLGAFAAPDAASCSTPFELGLAALVDLDAEHFTGRDALRRAKAQSPRHLLSSVLVDHPAPLRFSAIRVGGNIEGVVTSTGFSPWLGANVALAILKPGAVAKGAALHVEVEVREGLSLRSLRVPARLLLEPALALPARLMTPAPTDADCEEGIDPRFR